MGSPHLGRNGDRKNQHARRRTRAHRAIARLRSVARSRTGAGDFARRSGPSQSIVAVGRGTPCARRSWAARANPRTARKGATESRRDSCRTGRRARPAWRNVGGDRPLKLATTLAPNHPNAWRELGDQLTIAGETENAEAAYARHIKASVNNPELLQRLPLIENKLAVAEWISARISDPQPDRRRGHSGFAGETGSRRERYEDAENFSRARWNWRPVLPRHARLCRVLYRANKPAQAVEQAEFFSSAIRAIPASQSQAASLARLGETDRSHRVLRKVLKDHPQQPKAWMSYGHTLKAAGRQDDAIVAYGRASRSCRAGRSVVEPRQSQDVSLQPEAMSPRWQRALARTDIAETKTAYHLISRWQSAGGPGAMRTRSPITRGQRDAPARSSTITLTNRRRCAPHRRRCSRQEFFCGARQGLGQMPRPIRSSSSGCRAPARRCSSKFFQAISQSKARWNCPTSWRSRARSAAARKTSDPSAYPEILSAADVGR